MLGTIGLNEQIEPDFMRYCNTSLIATSCNNSISIVVVSTFEVCCYMLNEGVSVVSKEL